MDHLWSYPKAYSGMLVKGLVLSPGPFLKAYPPQLLAVLQLAASHSIEDGARYSEASLLLWYQVFPLNNGKKDISDFKWQGKKPRIKYKNLQDARERAARIVFDPLHSTGRCQQFPTWKNGL